MFYDDARAIIKSGDFVFYKKGEGFLDYLINLFTKSEWVHCGIAWVVNDRVFLLETSWRTGVRITLMSTKIPDTIIQTNSQWNIAAENFAFDLIGRPYSYEDAIRAGTNKRSNDDMGWICSELNAGVGSLMGFTFPQWGLTPEVILDVVKSFPRIDLEKGK